MGILLTNLGVSDADQSKAPQDVFTAEELIVALSLFYDEIDNESQKDNIADNIVELSRITMAEAKNIPFTT
jgi:hypothetical protein